MKYAFIFAAALTLPGCASFQQGVNAFGLAAVDSAKTTNDQAIFVWRTAACATPISAALRNPEVVPALRVLCMPATPTVPPSYLLDQMEEFQSRSRP